jgi:uncharacterized LabA/DUF88 family protein
MFDADLIVIDGPNLYNLIVRALAKFDQKLVGQYVRQWLDFDRVVCATIARETPHLGTVIFHSAKQLGSDKNVKLEGPDVTAFWARQGSNPFCSTEAVVLPGTQEEVIEGTCGQCGNPTSLKEKREKGVDTAITTYLWETSDKWSAVCIVSGDADFVPPVRSLKHRGKRVFCITEPGSSRRDLVQVSTSHLEIDLDFVRRDLAMFDVLRPAGALDQQLQETRSRFDNCFTKLEAGNTAGRAEGIQFFPIICATTELTSVEADLSRGAKDRFEPRGWAFLSAEIGAHDHSERTVMLRLFPGVPGKQYLQDPYLVDGALRHYDAMSSSDWFRALRE